MNKVVETSGYLVISCAQKRYGYHELKLERVARKKPSVASNEVALELRLRLPVALFEKPTLSAEINVEADVPRLAVTPETVSNIRDVIQSAIGLNVELKVVEQKGEPICLPLAES